MTKRPKAFDEDSFEEEEAFNYDYSDEEDQTYFPIEESQPPHY